MVDPATIELWRSAAWGAEVESSERGVGKMKRIVLQGGRKWGTVAPRQTERTVVAGLLPLRHLGSTLSHSDAHHHAHGLPRHLRLHARREEPTHCACQVPNRSLRRCRAGQG